MLRVRSVTPLQGRALRLTLTDGSIVERDIQDLLWGQMFDRLRTDDDLFRRARARHGTVTWPGDLDVAPETLIWDGPDPADDVQRPEPFLRPRRVRASDAGALADLYGDPVTYLDKERRSWD